MFNLFQILIVVSFTIQLLFIEACAQNKSFLSSDGRFSIELQATPTEDKNSAEVKLGGKKLWWRAERATFMVSYVDNPDAKKENAERAVIASADGYASVIPKAAEVISRKKIALEGHPGFEVISREKDGYTAVTRYFMVNTRLYCIMALWTDGQNDTDVLRTLDSFN